MLLAARSHEYQHSHHLDLQPWVLHTPEFHKHTSQGKQDGVLEYIYHHIGVTNKYYVVGTQHCLATKESAVVTPYADCCLHIFTTIYTLAYVGLF